MRIKFINEPINPERTSAFFSNTGWFEKSSSQTKVRLLSQARQYRLNKNETLDSLNLIEGSFVGVCEGLLGLTSAGSDEPRSLGIFGPPNWIEYSPVRPANAGLALKFTSLRNSLIVCIPRECFDMVLEANTAFAQFVSSQRAQRLNEAISLLRISRLPAVDERLSIFFSSQEFSSLHQARLTQEEVADLVGLSRQSVNKSIRKFSRPPATGRITSSRNAY
jgi:CRP/FNR family transcriptional regulator, cyclic AMP receptor protein